MESPKTSKKISEVVRLWQLLKKWRNFANSSKATITGATTSPNHSGIHKSISFLKRTIPSLSSDDNDGSNKKQHSSGNSNAVPKGYRAVCISEELERFVVPTHYLGHLAFGFLLQKAEEFRFQQTGVLRIPCVVPVFQSVVKMVEGKQGECSLGADETCVGLLSDGSEMSRRHLRHSRHHPWSTLCR